MQITVSSALKFHCHRSLLFRNVWLLLKKRLNAKNFSTSSIVSSNISNKILYEPSRKGKYVSSTLRNIGLHCKLVWFKISTLIE